MASISTPAASLRFLSRQSHLGLANDPQVTLTTLSSEPLCRDLENPVSIRSHSSSFSKFGELPQELRLAIWEAALAAPQLLQVRAQAASIYSDFFERPTLLVAFHTPTNIYAATLAVCKQSRDCALSRFPDSLPAYYGGRIPFNAETDLLFFTNFYQVVGCETVKYPFRTFGYRVPTVWGKLKRVALPWDVISARTGNKYPVEASHEASSIFRKIKKVIRFNGYREQLFPGISNHPDDVSTMLVNARMEQLEGAGIGKDGSRRFMQREFFLDQGHILFASFPIRYTITPPLLPKF